MNHLEPQSSKNYALIDNCIKKYNCSSVESSSDLIKLIELIRKSLSKDITCRLLGSKGIPINYYKYGLIYDQLKNMDNNIAKKYCDSIHKYGLDNRTNNTYSKYHHDIISFIDKNNATYKFHSKLYDISFIPIRIIKTIENKYNYLHNYTCTDGINTIIFKVYTKNEDPEEYFGKVHKLGILGLTLIKSQNISDITMTTYIWMTTHLKKIKKCIQYCYLGTDEINSGCTIRKYTDNWGTVYIWRQEELDKVFIHELIHALRLDFYEYPSYLDTLISHNFNISSSMRMNIFEAYTELWASLLNIIMNCIIHDMEHLINQFILYEKEWGILQIKHILHYFKLFSFKNKDFFCIECDSFKKEPLFNQKTNVFSYFILKSFFLCNYSDFLRLCQKYNTNYIKFSIPFPVLYRFIYSILNKDDLINEIDMRNISDLHNIKTLKMTLCQFE